MDEHERYFWDLTGYLIVRNVLTADELAAANEAVDHYTDRIRIGEDNGGARDSQFLRGTGRPTLSNLLQLEQPYCKPFRNMLGHPAVVLHLNVMCGKRFRLDHGPLMIGGIKGTGGLTLHGAGETHRPHVAYNHQNDAPYCGGVTVTWQLTDVNEGDGGFVCVPGSHKSKHPMPKGVRTCDDDLGVVVQPSMKAGDVLFFMDGAQTHGTHPWRSDKPRRSILFKYASQSSVRSGPAASLARPETWWNEKLVEGMTDTERAVMYGPYSNHHGEVPFLTVDEDGTVQIEK
ncbi:phytanoyl-CoA dioxygenase family protein [Candidatus Poribacteria bacterium]|nr:phytanoyl-CoA dioxygenase family protein [Candidatus Poribacteria bacterium]